MCRALGSWSRYLAALARRFLIDDWPRLARMVARKHEWKKEALMRKTLVLASVAALIAVFAVPALASGPHDKATGDVTWTAAGGAIPGVVSQFDVHDDPSGAVSTYGDRGTYWQFRPTGPGFTEGTLTIDVNCVRIDGDTARFAGTAVEKTGGYTAFGDIFAFQVVDNGTPGTAGPDQIGGTAFATLAAACNAVEGTTGIPLGGVVTDGNLSVFYDG